MANPTCTWRSYHNKSHIDGSAWKVVSHVDTHYVSFPLTDLVMLLGVVEFKKNNKIEKLSLFKGVQELRI